MNSLMLLAIMPIIGKSIFGYLEMPLEKKKTRYIWFCAIFIILVMGLRTRFTGSQDTDTYCKLFEALKNSGIGFVNYIKNRMADSDFLTSETGFAA